jgi:hypothetical protein
MALVHEIQQLVFTNINKKITLERFGVHKTVKKQFILYVHLWKNPGVHSNKYSIWYIQCFGIQKTNLKSTNLLLLMWWIQRPYLSFIFKKQSRWHKHKIFLEV